MGRSVFQFCSHWLKSWSSRGPSASSRHPCRRVVVVASNSVRIQLIGLGLNAGGASIRAVKTSKRLAFKPPVTALWPDIVSSRSGERHKTLRTPQAAGFKLHHVFWASQYGLQVSAKYLELQAFGLQDFGLQGYKAGPPGCQVAGLQVAGQGGSLAVGCGLQAGDCGALWSLPPRWAR
jgi:hypothetical protein